MISKYAALFAAWVLMGAASNRAQAASCYSFDVEPRTWYAVEAPDGYSFSRDVEQFRVGRPAVVWSAMSGLPVSYERRAGGWTYAVILTLPRKAPEFVRLLFAPALDPVRANVQCVMAFDAREAISRDIGTGGALFEVDLMGRRCRKLEIEVYSQFSRPPKVERIWGGSTHVVSRELPERLQSESWLFFRSPKKTDEPLELCSGRGSRYQLFADDGRAEELKPVFVALGQAHEPQGWLTHRLLGVLVLAGMLGLMLELYRLFVRGARSARPGGLSPEGARGESRPPR
ncbi:MAG: hypothetical protein JXR96_18260 [Deltaproteobacteria bacterium]|nr:hypothetical protein [Deltaproteobacteria bacterium]